MEKWWWHSGRNGKSKLLKKRKTVKRGHRVVERNVRQRKSEQQNEIKMNVKEALGEEAIEDFEDSNFEVPQVTHQTKQTWVEMYHFASELNRYHVGERAGAALWNAAIKDLEEASVIIKEKDTTI